MAEEPRVALVTGASGTIGSAIVRTLAAQGIRVAIGYRSERAAAWKLADELPGTFPVEVDVADPQAVRAAFKEIGRVAGQVTVLVNAAGVLRDRPLLRMRDEDWETVLRVNLTGAFHCVRQALPAMIAQRFGRIVSIGSVSAAVGLPGQAAYSASKAGLVGLTRSVAKETGRHGVTVNVIAPGLVESALIKDLPATRRAGFVDFSATGRLVEPADVANAVRFCLDTPGLTGQLINVDGGVC